MATITPITEGPYCHFFGYYDITPWNADDTHLLCLEIEDHSRPPKPGESASVCMVEQATGRVEQITETKCWNVQQGAMLHWHPAAPNTQILFNDLVDGGPIGVIHDIHSNERIALDKPITAVSSDGRHAAAVDYGRLQRLRKVVGYAGAVDPFPNEKHPTADGLHLIDLQTGEARLILSIAEIAERMAARNPKVIQKDAWFNHVTFNPTSTRLAVYGRTRSDDGKLESGLYTCDLDGANVRELLPYGSTVSHAAWRNDSQMLIWAKPWLADEDRPADNAAFILATDDDETPIEIIDLPWLGADGHMTFHPKNRDRFAVDSYRRDVILADLSKNWTHHIRRMGDVFLGNGDLRCDLHPRWNRAGTALCIDAIDTRDGTRQVHVVEDLDWD